MPRPKSPASPAKPVDNAPPHHRWWRTALIAATLSTGLYVFFGSPGLRTGQHALVLFVAVYLVVWFCNPARFFRRMSWVALMLVGGVVFVYFLHTKGYFGAQSSATFVIANAPWLVGIFTGAAVLFAVLEYLQYRSPPGSDVVGEEIVPPEAWARRRPGDDVPKFPPPAPFKRNKRIPDQETLANIVRHYAAAAVSSEAPKNLSQSDATGSLSAHTLAGKPPVAPERDEPIGIGSKAVVRMLRTEPDRVLDRLDAALARVDSLARSGNAQAKAAADAARTDLDIEPLQSFLAAEADRRGYKTREDATAYVAICGEIAGIAEVRGDWQAARLNLEEIIRLVPEDVDAFCRLGRACLLLNKLPNAEEAYQKVLVLSSEDEWRAMAFTNMGMVQLLQGSIAEAERVFDRALEIDERIGDVQGMAANYANLGSVCRQRGNRGKAEKMFNAALEIDEGLELSIAH